MESILTTIKKLLGPVGTYDNFDVDIITHINSTLSTLTQLGVGPDEGYQIEDDDNTWDEFLTDPILLGFAKTYIHHQVKLAFDPPTNAAVLEAMTQKCAELEWRLESEANAKKKAEAVSS